LGALLIQWRVPIKVTLLVKAPSLKNYRKTIVEA
jgi:hypothetical protein